MLPVSEVTGGLTAFDVAEVPQNAEPAVRVLDQELTAAVLEGKDPAARFNDERRCAGPLVDGGAGLRDGEPEGLVHGVDIVLRGPAGGIDGGADGFLRLNLLLRPDLGVDRGGGTAGLGLFRCRNAGRLRLFRGRGLLGGRGVAAAARRPVGGGAWAAGVCARRPAAAAPAATPAA